MKIKLHKHYYKGFVYALLLVVSATSLFAAKYNEPRKVLYSIQKNALYRNLTVSGDMFLNTKDGDNRTFLMEIGKRPTYFWDSNNAMHLLQTQTFNINNISHNGTEDNILNIKSILVPQGVFLSEGGLLFKKMYLYSGATGSIIGLPNSILNNLLFTLDKNVKTYIKYHTNDLQLIAETSGTYDTNTPIIDYLRTRDLTYNGVNFVSPRMVITKNTTNNTYSANGTARAYLELVNLTKSGDMKSYYGDWEVYSMGACNMEEIKGKDERVCRKWYNHKEGIPDPQGYDSGNGWVWDLSTDYFTCADIKKPSGGTEPGKYYDYVPESSGQVEVNYTCNDYLTTSSNVTANYPFDPYEFKVQEIFRLPKGDADPILIKQTPRFRAKIESETYKDYPISLNVKDPALSWSLDDFENINTYHFFVNSTPITGLPSIRIVPDSLTSSADEAKHPCLYVCEGTYCSSNRLYIRDNRRLRLVTDNNLSGDISGINTHWQLPAEQEVSRLAVVEYTVGVCPAISGTELAQFEAHEANFVQSAGNTVMMNGEVTPQIVEGKETFAPPQVCMRRRVACNKMPNGSKYKARTYQPLTTDY